MAITPLISQPIPEIKPLRTQQGTNGDNSTVSNSSSESSTTTSKDDLDSQIQETKSKNVRYQIIEKMLIKPGNEPAQKPGEMAQEISDARNQADDSVTLSSASLETLSAEQQEIRRNENGVSIRQDALNGQSLSFSQEAEPIQKTDPLAFDLDGNGLQTTGVNQGIEFDIDGDGKKEQTSFISGQDAFLAYDKNGNGVIDSGKELFGDQNGAANGYEELKKYDDNQDGRIDNQDAIYSKLQLLSSGENQEQKLTSLQDAGIQSIDLNYNNRREQLNLYDSIEQSATYTKEDGTTGKTGDILLGHK